MQMSDIRRINAEINSVPYMKELTEDWRPTSVGILDKINGADCDSYATGKMLELHKAGMSLESLRLMECNDEKGGLHCVLLVDFDNETYVLDNRRPEPTLMERVPYQWLRVQVGGTNNWEYA